MIAPDDAALVERVLATAAERRPRVVVVGDAVLDAWWVGDATRMSREAPTPVVAITGREDMPGGAANTAVNLAALGADVELVGLVGADAAGDRLLALLEAAGVRTGRMVRSPRTGTTVKTRVAGGGQLLLRIDEGGRPDDRDRHDLADAVAAMDAADAWIVCDYGLGALNGPVRDALAAHARRPAVVAVDAHDPAPWRVLAPSVVTPNAGETEALLGRPLGADRVAAARAARDEVLAATGAASVVVTLDRDGTVVHAADGIHRTETRPASDANASGAGDTFAAALVLALCAAEALPDAARFAQRAADVVVREPGTTVCSAAALIESVGSGSLVLAADELVRRLETERAAGRRIVFTNGCFDVLHLGHTRYLKQAKDLGDVLVVAVNDDDSVRRLKGEGRPINRAADRAGVIAELGCVDYVTVFGTDTPIPLLQRIRPDVYAKGGDYTPEMLEETPVVLGYGGRVHMVDYVSPHSTTSIIARVRAADAAVADE